MSAVEVGSINALSKAREHISKLEVASRGDSQVKLLNLLGSEKRANQGLGLLADLVGKGLASFLSPLLDGSKEREPFTFAKTR
jgi:hypothetical protein